MQHVAPDSVRSSLPAFTSASELLACKAPNEPVYCLYPHVVRSVARQFLSGFPGDVLYAVKANPAFPLLRRALRGRRPPLRHRVPARDQAHQRGATPTPSAISWRPVRFLGACAEAHKKYGVKDFVLDSDEEFEKILSETGARDLTLYVRLKTDVGGAVLELSSKFGVHDLDAVRLLRRVADRRSPPGPRFPCRLSLPRRGCVHGGRSRSAGM